MVRIQQRVRIQSNGWILLMVLFAIWLFAIHWSDIGWARVYRPVTAFRHTAFRHTVSRQWLPTWLPPTFDSFALCPPPGACWRESDVNCSPPAGCPPPGPESIS